MVIEDCNYRLPWHSPQDVPDYEANRQRLIANFERFGVTDHVRLYPHALVESEADKLDALIGTPELSGFLHDAEGRIDREFALYWPRTVEGGRIIIDDYEEFADRERADKPWPGGAKRHKICALLNQFMDWGLIEVEAVHERTVIGRKPVGADFSRFDPQRCAELVAEAEARHEAGKATQKRRSIPGV